MEWLSRNIRIIASERQCSSTRFKRAVKFDIGENLSRFQPFVFVIPEDAYLLFQKGVSPEALLPIV